IHSSPAQSLENCLGYSIGIRLLCLLWFDVPYLKSLFTVGLTLSTNISLNSAGQQKKKKA
ncbi:MAG: hypothetical protein V1792_07460, partial [Pseudomonadota bacterium]